jgi:hypothetical protein
VLNGFGKRSDAVKSRSSANKGKTKEAGNVNR